MRKEKHKKKIWDKYSLQKIHNVFGQIITEHDFPEKKKIYKQKTLCDHALVY